MLSIGLGEHFTAHNKFLHPEYGWQQLLSEIAPLPFKNEHKLGIIKISYSMKRATGHKES
jgi:hypothetical protein